MVQEPEARRLSRRDLIFGAGKGLAAIGIAATLGADPNDLSRASNIALTAARHPREAYDTYELWRAPQEKWKKSPLLTAKFEYSDHEQENIVIALGDSNMVGPYGEDRALSPIALFAKGASIKVGGEWETINIAQKGKTTQEIIDVQLQSREAEEAFSRAPQCDVWINAGGNDLSQVVRNKEEMLEIERLKDDPLGEPGILMKYVSRMVDNLKQYETNYAALLNALDRIYRGKIRHLVIISAPDFSRAHAITSQYIDNKTYRLPIGDGEIRRLVHNIAVRMNNAMFRVAQDFQEKNENGVRVIGINTFDSSFFGDDQHLNPDAFVAIANDAVSRIEIPS